MGTAASRRRSAAGSHKLANGEGSSRPCWKGDLYKSAGLDGGVGLAFDSRVTLKWKTACSYAPSPSTTCTCTCAYVLRGMRRDHSPAYPPLALAWVTWLKSFPSIPIEIDRTATEALAVGLMAGHRGRGPEGVAHTVAAPGEHVGQAFTRPASVTDQPRVDPHRGRSYRHPSGPAPRCCRELRRRWRSG